MKEYSTIVTNIIACDDLKERLDTAFYSGDFSTYLTDTALKDLIQEINDVKVINFPKVRGIKKTYDSLMSFAKTLPKEAYFIAYKAPIIRYDPKGRGKNIIPPSWDNTKITWVYLDNLNLINYFRYEAGKRADLTLEEGES